jgi:hypothetical protein
MGKLIIGRRSSRRVRARHPLWPQTSCRSFRLLNSHTFSHFWYNTFPFLNIIYLVLYTFVWNGRYGSVRTSNRPEFTQSYDPDTAHDLPRFILRNLPFPFTWWISWRAYSTDDDNLLLTCVILPSISMISSFIFSRFYLVFVDTGLSILSTK